MGVLKAVCVCVFELNKVAVVDKQERGQEEKGGMHACMRRYEDTRRQLTMYLPTYLCSRYIHG